MATPFQNYFAEIVQRQPQMVDENLKITFTVAQLKRNLEKAFNRGYQEAKNQKPSDPLADLFGGFFGGKK